MKKVFIIIAVVLVGLIGVTKIMITSKAPAQKQSSAAPVPSGWEMFTSKKFGYSLQHPQGWMVDDSLFPSKQEILVSSPTKDAALRINAFFDKAVNSPETIKASMEEFEKKMRSEPDMTVAQFKGEVEEKTGGFIATGEQVIAGEPYIFENRGLLGTSGKILIFYGVVKKSVVQQYEGTIAKLIEGFRLEE